MNVQRNMGRFDQTLRVGIGMVLIYYGFLDTSWMQASLIPTLVGVFGIVNIVVSLFGVCPAYYLADINTHPGESDNESTGRY